MSRWILRITGGCFLGSALLVEQTRHESAKQLTSVKQRLTLQVDQVASVSFVPSIEEAAYLIDLNFDRAQRKLLSCPVIHSSNVQWSLIEGSRTIKTGNLSDATVKCRETDAAIIFDLPVPDHLRNQRHSLNLVANQQPEVNLQTNVSITPFGIAVHYAFMDLAVQELALGALLLIGLGCFLPDLYRVLFRRKPRQHR
jgi:hypothetical protein